MIETLIAAVPPTIAALAAWRAAAITKRQTNGALHEPLGEIRADVAEIRLGLAEHREEHRRGVEA